MLSIKKNLLTALALITLTGCAAQNPAPDAPIEESSATPVYQPGEFNEESIFELLTAELAGQQRDFDTAQQLLERQAELNHSPELAERATRLAQFLRDPDKTERAAELWRELAPTDEAPFHILINLLLMEERVDEALNVVESDQELSTETLMVINSHLNTFDEASAERLIELIEQRAPLAQQRLDQVLLNVRLLAHLKQFDAALALIDQGLAIEPGQVDLIIEKIQILANYRAQPAQALKLIERTLKEHPTHRQLRALQIQQLIKLDPKRIEPTVKLAVKQADDDPQIRYYYALLMLENNQPALSEQLFKGLIESDPQATELYLYLGILAAQRGDKTAALDAFSQVESGDSLMNATSRALKLLDSATELDTARALIAESLTKDVERVDDLHVLFAQWLNEQDSTESALTYLTEQLLKTPDNARLLYARAMIHDALDAEAMLRDLEAAYEQEPESPTIQNALGYSLLEYSDQYERAFELIQSALDESPNEAAVIDSMGWALHKLGRNQEALPYLEQAYESFPDPEVGSHLIIVLCELGLRERAQQIYDELIKTDPDNPDLAKALEWLRGEQP